MNHHPQGRDQNCAQITFSHWHKDKHLLRCSALLLLLCDEFLLRVLSVCELSGGRRKVGLPSFSSFSSFHVCRSDHTHPVRDIQYCENCQICYSWSSWNSAWGRINVFDQRIITCSKVPFHVKSDNDDSNIGYFLKENQLTMISPSSWGNVLSLPAAWMDAEVRSVPNYIKCIIKIDISCLLPVRVLVVIVGVAIWVGVVLCGWACSLPLPIFLSSKTRCPSMSMTIKQHKYLASAAPKFYWTSHLLCATFISIMIQMSSRLVWGTPRGGIWCPSIINAMGFM